MSLSFFFFFSRPRPRDPPTTPVSRRSPGLQPHVHDRLHHSVRLLPLCRHHAAAPGLGRLPPDARQARGGRGWGRTSRAKKTVLTPNPHLLLSPQLPGVPLVQPDRGARPRARRRAHARARRGAGADAAPHLSGGHVRQQPVLRDVQTGRVRPGGGRLPGRHPVRPRVRRRVLELQAPILHRPPGHPDALLGGRVRRLVPGAPDAGAGGDRAGVCGARAAAHRVARGAHHRALGRLPQVL